MTPGNRQSLKVALAAFLRTLNQFSGYHITKVIRAKQ